MLIHKNICSSYFFTLLIISIIILTSPSTMFGEDTTIYDPTKGTWVSLGTQCPQGASGPATEPVNPWNTLNPIRIYMQYKVSQTYDFTYNGSGGYYKSADGCKDGSIVPASNFSSPPCLANFITTQCVDFPGYPIGNGPPWEGEFPIYWRCYDFTNSLGHHFGWTWQVMAFCTKYLTAYEWRLNNNPDLSSNFGGSGDSPTGCPNSQESQN
jgi:hypothetical protein